ncbi:MAG TPA: hypothetical protein VNZ03_19080 [Terriglobales bacterium]|nr:hypothetical protein [Terriglobales bacterium]
MKFANKYELFEAVTSGRVETFFAKDLASGERVLLHIFEAPEKKPDQPTVHWVLDSFRSVAPPPPGLVVETGRYNGTTYAYLVTKLPDTAALQHWAQAYESSSIETQEIAIPIQGTSKGGPPISRDLSRPNLRPAEESKPVSNAAPPSNFTAAFSGPAVSPRPESKGSTTDRDEIDVAPEPGSTGRRPGDFTRQFFSGSHEAPKTLVTQPSAELPDASAPSNRGVPSVTTEGREAANAKDNKVPGGGSITNSPPSPDPGGFTALFRSSFKSETGVPAERLVTPAKSDEASAGDFTNFFRGPFDKDQPAETPMTLSKPLDPPQRNATGEFTRVFGSGKDGPFSTRPLPDSVGDPPQEAGAFTQLFPDASPPAPSLTNAPARTWEPVAPKKEIPPASREPMWTAPAPPPAKPPVIASVEPILPKPTVSSTLREAEPSLPDGATHLFSAPGRPASSPPPIPAGPSEYTRIISGGIAGSTPAEAPFASGSQKSAPALPKFAAPPPPKFSPPAPKVPQGDIKAPKPKASYLPLVIILNVLLFIAILLIVYFAMKH